MTGVLEISSTGSNDVDMPGNIASAEVLDSEGAEDASGIIVVATGDVGPAACTCIALAISVPRAGPGRLDSWARCSAADDSDTTPDSGRASDIDEI